MEDLTLIIGNKNYSSWSLRPWLVLKHFEIPFKEIVIPLFQPGSKEKILEISPSGKVPSLKHKNLVIWESIAVCEYLAEFFPKKNLWPSDKEARALARAVSAEMHAGFIDLRKACPMNVKATKPQEPTEPVKQNIARIIKIWEDSRRMFKKNGDFLFGEFSIADAMYAPVIWRFNTYGVKLTGIANEYFNTMLKLPAMVNWRQAALKEPWEINHH